ncbi:hypothetical protein GKC33_04360 [Lactobacillus salivarius]|uniref:Uncharacterized protein n=1 Tax=Ligilactobacillus salivarius TaxID=1624 RepID=A0A6A8LLN7_9LACO|nr:hypothetical protein [Ligilactobacillus salivarius]MSE06981.1 hypothetical protein [Ligilactobacillus salivarius]MSE07976.1 hypothetical protein [Ligilactobacillus salivarius]
MNRKYGVPNSVKEIENVDSLFELDVDFGTLPDYSWLVNKLLNNVKEAKKFIKNPDKYLENNGIHKLKSINMKDRNLEFINIVGDNDIIDSIYRKDARKFINVMKDKNILPERFIDFSSNVRKRQQVAYVPVVVTPAAIYTSFGVVAWAVVGVGAAAFVGIKVKVSVAGKKLNSTFQSNILHPKVSSVLSIALLLSDNDFAHRIDTLLWKDFWEEVNERTEKMRIKKQFTILPENN